MQFEAEHMTIKGLTRSVKKRKDKVHRPWKYLFQRKISSQMQQDNQIPQGGSVIKWEQLPMDEPWGFFYVCIWVASGGERDTHCDFVTERDLTRI